jgi:hypothetical protein
LDLFIEIFVSSSEYTDLVPKFTSVFGVLAHENNKNDTQKIKKTNLISNL